MSYCVNCGNEIQEGYEFCPECGSKISNHVEAHSENRFANSYNVKYKLCKYCGERMPEDAFYCLSCGETFDIQAYDFEDVKKRILNTGKTQNCMVDTSVGVWKNKWVALLLCAFFGVFGVHRFYEEKKIIGFIYLFTFGLFGVGVLFDIILLATKSNPYRVK